MYVYVCVVLEQVTSHQLTLQREADQKQQEAAAKDAQKAAKREVRVQLDC